MSVEDVCELGSILQSGDKEKQILERKLIELDGAIQTQDRRLNHEVEEEQWARNEQSNLLECAVDVSNNFEIASSVLSQLHDDAVGNQKLFSILKRVEAYIALRNDLVDDIGSVQGEIGRLQAASKKVEELENEAIAARLIEAKKLLESNETVERDMKTSMRETGDDIEKKRNQISEKLVSGAKNISDTFSQLEQKRFLINEKRLDLEKRTAGEQEEADTTLISLKGALAVSTANVDKVNLHKNQLVTDNNDALVAIERDAAALRSCDEQNKFREESLRGSSEAENDTSKEVEDAKKLLLELDKFASDHSDELDRIRRAQVFETAREVAFVKSQSGNASSVQQICQEAERLRSSLDLVRSEIAIIKQQITLEPGVEIKGVHHEEMEQLQATEKAQRTRSERAQERATIGAEERDQLEQKRLSGIARQVAAEEQIKELQKSHSKMLEDYEAAVHSIEVLTKEAEDVMIPSDFDELSASIIEELEHVSTNIKTAEEEEVAAEEQGVAACAALKVHEGHLEAYNAEKARQYQIAEKDKRLQLSRQEKLADSDRALQLLQEELNREDEKFKEAIRVAENSARATEEKLVETMNQVIAVGLQLVADRNNLEIETRDVEAKLKIEDERYKSQLAALAEAKAKAAQSALTITDASRGRGPSGTAGTTRSQSQSQRDNTGIKAGQRALRNEPLHNSWASSAPATKLPEQSQSDEEDEDDPPDMIPIASQSNQRKHPLQEDQVLKQNTSKRVAVLQSVEENVIAGKKKSYGSGQQSKVGRPKKVLSERQKNEDDRLNENVAPEVNATKQKGKRTMKD